MALWKEVSGYEGMYLVSDQGDVVSLPRKVKSGTKTINRAARELKPHLRGKNGQYYVAVTLSAGGESKAYSVHRLVAQAFIPNPLNLPEVNHKDENPLNNNVENLEWCTRQYNIDYSKSKPVAQIKDGLIIAKFKSIKEAGRRTGINRKAINNVLTGWAKTAGGFNWNYC